jgi:hypothetical protein
MKTIRRFNNIAEADFAQSLLESDGLTAALADDLIFALGPGYAPHGIRLQVAEEDMERAEQILAEHKGFEPLPEDFVPPETSTPETVGAALGHETVMSRGGSFLLGGALALGTAGFAFVILSALLGGRETWRMAISPTVPFLIFLGGGWVGLGYRAFRLGRLRVRPIDPSGRS